MKLYKVTLCGMTYSIGSEPIYGIAYVVAPDETTAYQKVNKRLMERDIGFPSDRVLKTIELVAESDDYAGCKIRLYE